MICLHFSEVQDIFGTDFQGGGGPALPPKQRPSSVQREKVSESLIPLPRPPSRISSAKLRPARAGSSSPKNETTKAGGASPPPPLLPAKSIEAYGRQSSIGSGSGVVGLSRGPSPLTIGASDVVPLAVAFQEVCHACFRGAEESQVHNTSIMPEWRGSFCVTGLQHFF